MRADKSTTAAFSGHRIFRKNGDSLFETPDRQTPEAVRERLLETVKRLAAEGYTDFLCGMAEGFDLLAAEAVLAARAQWPRLRFIAVVPFPGQAAGFGEPSRSDYNRLLSQADAIVTVSPAYAPDCFHRRNDWLVDNASALVCYYDGSKGGTQYTVRRALKKRLRVINLL